MALLVNINDHNHCEINIYIYIYILRENSLLYFFKSFLMYWNLDLIVIFTKQHFSFILTGTLLKMLRQLEFATVFCGLLSSS